MSQRSDDWNPFEAPPPDLPNQTDELTGLTADEIRLKYLPTEGNVRTIASLMLLCAIGGPLTALATVIVSGPHDIVWLSMAMLLLPLLIGQGAIAVMMYRLAPSARYAAIMVSAFWMLLFPVGTALGLICVLELRSSRAAFVFSDRYKEIVDQTSSKRPGSSRLVWLVVTALVLLCIVLVFG